jgi:hypothetical protein
MEETKISERDFVTYVLVEDNIKILIKYPKVSTIRKRLELIEKFKEMLRRI